MKDFDYLYKIIYQIIQNIVDETLINISEFGFTDDFWKIELPLRAYELVHINITIKQRHYDPSFKLNIEADKISMKLVLTTHDIHFNSELNELLGFRNEYHTKGTHKSEKPVMITTTGKVHLKCDFEDGSIVDGIREQISLSFSLSATPGNKKEPNIILYLKNDQNNVRHDPIFP